MTPNMICTLGILLAASIDDLKFRRVHNNLLAILAVITLAVVFYTQGISGLKFSLLGFALGLALYFPLAWFKLLGGGDLKLLAVTGLAAGPARVLWIGVAAFIWGAILGVIQVLIKGEFKKLMHNTLAMAQRQKVERADLHKIPFAVAMFLAAISSFVFERGVL